MLSIKSLSKVFNEGKKRIEAISNINAEIGKNEFVVFLGPSGCGKTTLLKCIAGLIKPTSGEIVLNGQKITQPNKDIGMVFQEYSLFEWLTVSENIAFGLNINTDLSDEEKERIVEYYLSITGLADFKDVYPKFLSSGMKQRVAIARTLANNPKVVLMDEPFGALDSFARASMQEFLTNLWHKNKKTIIFVTHDIEEAIFLADTIHILDRRPATTKHTITVDFKRPRKLVLKTSEEFFDMKNKIINFLT